jgi:hypothetical protein
VALPTPIISDDCRMKSSKSRHTYTELSYIFQPSGCATKVLTILRASVRENELKTNEHDLDALDQPWNAPGNGRRQCGFEGATIHVCSQGSLLDCRLPQLPVYSDRISCLSLRRTRRPAAPGRMLLQGICLAHNRGWRFWNAPSCPASKQCGHCGGSKQDHWSPLRQPPRQR